MGLDNDAFRKFLDESRVVEAKKGKHKKKSSAKPGMKPGVGKGTQNTRTDEKDDGPKYRCVEWCCLALSGQPNSPAHVVRLCFAPARTR
jgi:hypothetical protein